MDGPEPPTSTTRRGRLAIRRDRVHPDRAKEAFFYDVHSPTTRRCCTVPTAPRAPFRRDRSARVCDGMLTSTASSGASTRIAAGCAGVMVLKDLYSPASRRRGALLSRQRFANPDPQPAGRVPGGRSESRRDAFFASSSPAHARGIARDGNCVRAGRRYRFPPRVPVQRWCQPATQALSLRSLNVDTGPQGDRTRPSRRHLHRHGKRRGNEAIRARLRKGPDLPRRRATRRPAQGHVSRTSFVEFSRPPTRHLLSSQEDLRRERVTRTSAGRDRALDSAQLLARLRIPLHDAVLVDTSRHRGPEAGPRHAGVIHPLRQGGKPGVAEMIIRSPTGHGRRVSHHCHIVGTRTPPDGQYLVLQKKTLAQDYGNGSPWPGGGAALWPPRRRRGWGRQRCGEPDANICRASAAAESPTCSRRAHRAQFPTSGQDAGLARSSPARGASRAQLASNCAVRRWKRDAVRVLLAREREQRTRPRGGACAQGGLRGDGLKR